MKELILVAFAVVVFPIFVWIVLDELKKTDVWDMSWIELIFSVIIAIIIYHGIFVWL